MENTAKFPPYAYPSLNSNIVEKAAEQVIAIFPDIDVKLIHTWTNSTFSKHGHDNLVHKVCDFILAINSKSKRLKKRKRKLPAYIEEADSATEEASSSSADKNKKCSTIHTRDATGDGNIISLALQSSIHIINSQPTTFSTDVRTDSSSAVLTASRTRNVEAGQSNKDLPDSQQSEVVACQCTNLITDSKKKDLIAGHLSIVDVLDSHSSDAICQSCVVLLDAQPRDVIASQSSVVTHDSQPSDDGNKVQSIVDHSFAVMKDKNDCFMPDIIDKYEAHMRKSKGKSIVSLSRNDVQYKSSNRNSHVEETEEIFLPCDGCNQPESDRNIIQCEDAHLTCTPCVEQQAKEVMKGNQNSINCPVKDCAHCFGAASLGKVLPKFLLEALEEKSFQDSLGGLEILKCPECAFMVEVDPEVEVFKCPNKSCKKSTCRYCRKEINATNAAEHNNCVQKSQQLTPPTKAGLDLPEHWTYKDSSAFKQQGYAKVKLDPTSNEFRIVATKFYNTMKHRIDSIHRVENPNLWKAYSLHRSLMLQENGEQGLNERQLFHGTRSSVIDLICEQNFDFRITPANGSAYGRGSYFAVQASKSHQYSYLVPGGAGYINFNNPVPVVANNSHSLRMFLARVLCGNDGPGAQNLYRPYEIPNHPRGKLYDSVSDFPGTGNSHIYVIFERWQCYPEYIIDYY